MQTTVTNIRHAPPNWRHDPQYVYIGRGSPYGNPYPIGQPHPVTNRPMTRDDVCDLFEAHTLPILKRELDLASLKGKILVCFCHPQRCHGHPLAKAIDEA